MNKLFNTLSKEPTPLDEFKEFNIINYSTVSDVKATRLSQLTGKCYPEPFILEVKEKKGNTVHYKAHTFKTLQEAQSYQEAV